MNTYKNNMMSIAIALLLSGATLSGTKSTAADALKQADTAEIGQNYADDVNCSDKEKV